MAAEVTAEENKDECWFSSTRLCEMSYQVISIDLFIDNGLDSAILVVVEALHLQ